MESAAKKVKSMWLAKKVHGVKRSCLETIFEKTPLNVYHRTGINWLDFKRRQGMCQFSLIEYLNLFYVIRRVYMTQFQRKNRTKI